MLLPVISREMRHAVNTKAVVRESDPALHRGVCGMSLLITRPSSIMIIKREIRLIPDFCSSTIFGGFFFCQKCGKDYCLQCERYFSDSMEAIRESPWDIPDAARPRLLKCTLAPPEKGTLAGKPPLEAGAMTTEAIRSPLSVAKSPGLIRSSEPDRLSTNVEVDGHLRTLPTSGDPNEPRLDDLTATETAIDDRASIDDMPSESAPNEVESSGLDSSSAMVVDAALGVTGSHIAVETQQDSTGPDDTPGSTQGITRGQSGSNDDHITTPTNPIVQAVQAPVLESRPRPSTYKSSAPTPAVAKATVKRSLNFHVRPDLIPVTRFHAKDLEAHWYKLASFVLDGTGSLEDRMKWFYPTHVEVDNSLSANVQQYIENHPTSFPTSPTADLTDEEKAKYYVKTTNPTVEAIQDPAGLREKSHPFMFVQAPELDNELFDRLWARGEPIVVDKVGERFKQTWTPDTFIERFGKEGCCKSSFAPRIRRALHPKS